MTTAKGRSDIQKLAAPALTAAALRLALMIAVFFSTGIAIMTQGDTQSYLTPGRNFILHGSYSNGGLPEIDRTPGYPLFAMLTGMIAENVLLVVVVQILASLVSLWLVWRIAERIFPASHTGVIAAWFYALEPLSVLYTARLMPETLFVLLILGMIDQITVFQQKSQLKFVALAGLFLAGATYVRPVSYYLFIPVAVGLALTPPRPPRHWWKAPALLVIAVLPLLVAWQIRNAHETGYSGFSSIVEKNLYFYQSAAITAEVEHRSLASEQARLGYLSEKDYTAAHPEQKQWSQAERLLFMRRDAMGVLAAHRWLYLRSHIAGVGVVAFTPCASEWLQMLGLYPGEQSMPHRILNEGITDSITRVASEHIKIFTFMLVLEAVLSMLYVLAIVGCSGSSGTTKPILLLVGVVLYFLCISGGAQAVGRYRLPVMPELCILAAGGIMAQKQKAGSIDVVKSRFAKK